MEKHYLLLQSMVVGSFIWSLFYCDKVKQGINTIEMSVSPMSIYAEIEPVYVIGDFSVVPEKKGWSITTPVEKLTLGSWKEQKQPFYSWEVSYTKGIR